MSEIAHLIELTQEGDPDGAAELLRLARRHNDPLLALKASFAVGDVDSVVTIVTAMWDDQSDDIVAVFQMLGFTTESREWLETSLSNLVVAANQKGRLRRVTVTDGVQTLVRAMASAHGLAWTHGGDAKSGQTSYLMAVRRVAGGRELVLGGGRGRANPPSPKKGFPRMSSWTRSFDANLRSARAWAMESPAEGGPTLHFVPTADERTRIQRVDGDVGARALARVRASAAGGTKLDGIDNDVVVLLEATPSVDVFNSLIRLLRKRARPSSQLELIDSWLDTHWPIEVRCITRRVIAQVAKAPERPLWRLVRGLEFPGGNAPISDADAQCLAEASIWRDVVEGVVIKRAGERRATSILTSMESLEKLDAIELEYEDWDVDAFREIAESPAWRRVRSLTISAVDDLIVEMIRTASSLAYLSLPSGALRPAVVAVLAQCKPRSLSLANATIRDADACSLFGGPALSRLESLDLSRLSLRDNKILMKRVKKPRAFTKLGTAKYGSALTSITARDAPWLVDEAGLVALIEGSRGGLPNLTHLDVRGSKLDGSKLVSIAELKGLRRFTSLRIAPTKHAPKLAAALAKSPYLKVPVEAVLSDHDTQW